MRIADVNGRTRAEVAQRLLGTRDSALARALGERFQLRYYGFSSRADPIPDGRALKFAGGRTLGAALDRARRESLDSSACRRGRDQRRCRQLRDRAR